MSEILSHPVPAVIFLLGILVFVHEFGHFIVGRMCGIAVETFSIGFGPPIVRFTRGGTDYRISWVPLGGYVKFAGSHPSEDVPSGLDGIPFRDASLAKRAAAVIAGPLFNFVLAISVYAVLGASGIKQPPASIGGVMENSAAEAAGIKYGDVLVDIDGAPIEFWRDLEGIISKSAGKTLPIKVKRGDEIVSLTLTPKKVEVTNFLGNRVSIGRAGIALGRMSPVVHVTSKDSPAVNAGLKSGDEIVAVSYSGVDTEVKYFPDLEAAVQKIMSRGTPYIEFKIRKSAIPGDKESKPGKVRSITLNTGAFKDLAPETAFLKALNISDAQLTIVETRDTLKDVLKRGDRIFAWNGVVLRNIFHLRELLEENKAKTVNLTIDRNFVREEIEVSLKPLDVQKPEGKVTIYTFPALFWGQLVDPEYLVEQYTNPFSALAYGFSETIDKSGSLIKSVAKLFTGEVPLGALGGPMLIAKVAGDSVKAGWQTFLGSLALISINLGIINLFPIPVLDGGQLVLMGAELVRRKPMKESAIENFQKLGFAMIMALVVLATYNDLSRFWKSMLESVVGVFQ
jgi:regulator of sigma E protease